MDRDRLAILDLLRAQKLLLDAAIEALTDSIHLGRPTPIQYTTREGGAWFIWQGVNHNREPIHAVKFSDDTIFDCVSGWRPFVTIVAESK